MTLLLIGLVLFIGVHCLNIVSSQIRTNWVSTHSEFSWRAIYAFISIVGFALIVIGYGQARQTPIVLWNPPTGMKHLVLLLMVPVFTLIFATYLPGKISAKTQHPMLLATKLWAFSHLLANGNLADVLLFGSFLLWAGANRASLKRRTTARSHPTLPASPANDWIALIGGLAVYAWFLLQGHAWLIGVSPLGG